MEQKLIKRNHTSQLTLRTSQKGITLIALVVTIVVMLILAGVVISMVTGDEGIISNAKYSKQQQIEKEHIDAIKVAMSGADIEAEISGIKTKRCSKYN